MINDFVHKGDNIAHHPPLLLLPNLNVVLVPPLPKISIQPDLDFSFTVYPYHVIIDIEAPYLPIQLFEPSQTRV